MPHTKDLELVAWLQDYAWLEAELPRKIARREARPEVGGWRGRRHLRASRAGWLAGCMLGSAPVPSSSLMGHAGLLPHIACSAAG